MIPLLWRTPCPHCVPSVCPHGRTCVAGAVSTYSCARSCLPYLASFLHSPLTDTPAPGWILAKLPTTVIKSPLSSDSTCHEHPQEGPA